MILCLFRGKSRHRRQYTERIRRKENYLGGMPTFGDRTNNVVDMINGIGDPGILGFGTIGVIDLSILVHDNMARVPTEALVPGMVK